MTAAWPASVPQFSLQQSYGEQPERNVIEFTPEVGPPMSRRRTSISTDIIDFETIMTFDEYDALVSFYRTDLKDGVLPFLRGHPRNPEVSTNEYEFRFMTEPKLKAISPDLCSVAMRVRRMPA